MPSVQSLTLADFEPRAIFVDPSLEWLDVMRERQAKLDNDGYKGGVIEEAASFTIGTSNEPVGGQRYVLLTNVVAVATQLRQCDQELAKAC